MTTSPAASPDVLPSLPDAHAVYHHLVNRDLVRDMRVGLNLAFYRTFAVPRIAALLAHTGELHRQPHKRSIDTGLWMYELIDAGFDSYRGRRVVTALNKMHRRWSIADEDYLYVLLTFVIVPDRWLSTYGPRPQSAYERAATLRFYLELGQRMNIPDLPKNWLEASAWFSDYESRNVGYSDAGRGLMTDTRLVMAEQLPGPLKPAATLLTRLILEPHVAEAVGLRSAPRAARTAMRVVAAGRRVTARRHQARDQAWFAPGRAIAGLYPHGYSLDQLGPQSVNSPWSSTDS